MKLYKAIFLSLLLAGCECKPPKNNQSISINIELEPGSLDPRKVRILNDVNLVRTFMDGLMRVSLWGTTELALADHYTLSDDEKTYTFHLRDAVWSNGDSVKAQDFVYAWKKSLSPDFPSDLSSLLFVIKNAKFIKEGKLPTNMLGVVAEDDYTLKITLAQKTPYFLELLTLPIFFPVHPSTDTEATFLCNGPFLLKEWHHNDRILAVKNPKYWDADAVRLESITMTMVSAETGLSLFETKELDWIGSPFSSIPTDAIPKLKTKNSIKVDPLIGTYWIRTNTATTPLSDEAVRKALAIAIDRDAIINHVEHGCQEVATGIVPTSMGLQPIPYFTDGGAQEAQELLASAKQPVKSLTLIYGANSHNHKIAQTVQDQWRKTLGIEVKLEALEPKVALSRIRKGDYQLATGSWIADFRDPVNILEVFKTKNLATNSTNWESPNYQKALEESYLISDATARKEQLRKTEQILMEEMPVIPIFHYTMLHANSDRLHDVVLTNSGHIDFKWAYVEK